MALHSSAINTQHKKKERIQNMACRRRLVLHLIHGLTGSDFDDEVGDTAQCVSVCVEERK